MGGARVQVSPLKAPLPQYCNFLFWGHNRRLSGTSGSVLRNYSSWCSGDPLGCWRLNPSRQILSLLHPPKSCTFHKQDKRVHIWGSQRRRGAVSLRKVGTGHAPGHSGHSIRTGELSRPRGVGWGGNRTWSHSGAQGPAQHRVLPPPLQTGRP